MPIIRKVGQMSRIEKRDIAEAEVRKLLRSATYDLRQNIVNQVETLLTDDMTRHDIINKIHEIAAELLDPEDIAKADRREDVSALIGAMVKDRNGALRIEAFRSVSGTAQRDANIEKDDLGKDNIHKRGAGGQKTALNVTKKSHKRLRRMRGPI